MEREFRNPGARHGGPSFYRLMIDNLRKQREEHPVIDFAAGNLPIVGGVQGLMDATDERSSATQRGLSALSFIPGGKLVDAIIGRLRGAPVNKMVDDKPFTPEEIFQKPDVKMTPEERAANLVAKNEEARKIAEQWLKDNPE